MTANPRPVKVCGMCGESRPLDDFYRASRATDGRQSRCKPCAKAAKAAYRAANAERVKASTAAYYAANAERVKAAKAAYYAANAERVKAYAAAYRAANAERVKAYAAAYRAANAERVKAAKATSSAAYRASVNGNDVRYISDKDLRRLYASPCVDCGSRDGIQMDHVIPICRGGRHAIGNLAARCRRCNRSKSAKLPIEHRAGLSMRKPAGRRVDDLVSESMELLARYAPHYLAGDAPPPLPV